MRALVLLLVICAGCSGPVPMNLAIQPRHEREYATVLQLAEQRQSEHSTGVGGTAALDICGGWYTVRAGESGRTIDQVRAADLALSTTRNPFDANRDFNAVGRGAVLFRENCARCHGADARGNGPDMLASHPTSDFHGFAKRFAVTLHGGAPRAWFRKISEGYGDQVEYPASAVPAPSGQPSDRLAEVTRSPAMPAFGGTLAREQIWLVITYLQSLDCYVPRETSADGAASND